VDNGTSVMDNLSVEKDRGILLKQQLFNLHMRMRLSI